MAKFLLGVIVGAVFAILALVVIGFAVARFFASKQPTIASNSALILSLHGDVPEAAPVEIPLPFFQKESSPTVRDVWTSLREAAKDDRIKAVVIEPKHLVTGWAKLQELHQELLDFKRSGKPVYAYLQGPGSHEYYLATAADKIYVSPDDMVDVKGFALEELYFKGSLDKLGISMQVDHIGKYKDAGDIFTRTNMSPETRETLGQVLDQIYGEFCATVGQARHKSADDVKAVIDMGPFIAADAKSAGLVDELGYEDQVIADLKKKTGSGELNKTGIKTYSRAAPGSGDHIALLVGEGEIVAGESDSTSNQGQIAASEFIRTIRQIRNDHSIKGVILRVDSPGGDAVASDDILHELKLLSGAKPLVISMSDLAASGGYFISMTGNRVVAYPDTITGSIGVLYVRPNLHGLFDKLGIQTDTLARGKSADMDLPDVPLSDADKQKLHNSIEATYRSFVGKVAAARKKTFTQIDALAQGRVWMGAQAHDNGLIDELGGLDQAIAAVRRRANLPPAGETNLIEFPPHRSLFEVLMGSSPEMSGEAKARAAVEATLRESLPQLPGPAMLKGGMMSILPYRIAVH
jgi:protease-4